ncbi:MAG: acetate kinase [Spirochaetales bacterium]|nr:acetate kinase [Spirochaetales bacterium]
MVILTLNCGSSSAKYQVFDWDQKEVLGVGMIERIGQPMSNMEHNSKGKEEYEGEKACPTHKEAIEWIIETLVNEEYGCIKELSEVKAVGHRVLHGGEEFKKSVLIDEKVLETFKSLYHLGPLHMPPNVMGIEGAMAVLPEVPHCAVMDTAWHQTMPASSYMYALPYEWYEKFNVRRYGFHGSSYVYTAKRASVLLGKEPKDTNVIICHIGNGASMCAVKDGCCYDTTMGLTPLEGLMMGTRCGDIDPAIVPFIMDATGLTTKEVDTVMNKKSGILGITEKYIDRRDVEDGYKEGEEKAVLALEMETYRVKKYIGSYMAALGRTDAIIFTAGVGEMSPTYRAEMLKGLENLGVKIDLEKNGASRTRNAETCISADDSPIKVFVIPTDEELVMTEDTYALVKGTYDVHTNFTYSFQSKDYVNKAREEALPGNLKKKPELASIIVKP